jgi:hypothetical protein
MSIAILLVMSFFILNACTGGGLGKKPVPRTMAEVPAVKLAYRFEPDVETPADTLIKDDPSQKSDAIQKDFDTRRKDDALIRVVPSPDGQRALVLYETGENRPGEYRVDLYDAAGNFLRNVTPPEFAGAFASAAEWSPDGSHVIFAGKKPVTPKPSPTPEEPLPTGLPTPAPAASVQPIFAPLEVFNTEQIYICDRDGANLKPLTARDGLIYFGFNWSPDSRSIAALACKEEEWNSRFDQHKTPQGRPRIIDLDGKERLLDDGLTETVPDWSPDGTKVATAFDTDVKIYDVRAQSPTQAVIPLHDALIEASANYDRTKLSPKNKAVSDKQDTPAPAIGTPISFTPIVRLDWPDDKDLFVQTAFVRIYGNEPVNQLQRWHVLHLSPQASIMGEQINKK